MKKVFSVLSMLLVTTGMFAQDKFYTDWYMQLQGGIGETVGETKWTNLLSPAAALSVGYQATPVFGIRGNLSGWQAKGYSNIVFDDYKFNFGQIAADATFDLCNLFGGYKSRLVNPYALIGIGANLRMNNGATLAMLPEENFYWEDKKVSAVGRLGAGVDFRISDAVKIGLEIVDNGLSDHFNSKVGDKIDQQIDALVGVKFSLGSAKKQAAAEAAAAAAAAEEAARLAAEKAAQERAAQEKAAQERAAAAAAEQAQKAAKEAAEKAAAEERAKARSITENVLFVIDRWKVRTSQEEKIAHVVEVMKEYPEAVVTISGYADKQTGWPAWNKILSQHRCDAVEKKLVEAGIDASRITKEAFGSEVNPFETPELNRVAVLVTK